MKARKSGSAAAALRASCYARGHRDSAVPRARTCALVSCNGLFGRRFAKEAVPSISMAVICSPDMFAAKGPSHPAWRGACLVSLQAP
jgi:hypothetical protein